MRLVAAGFQPASEGGILPHTMPDHPKNPHLDGLHFRGQLPHLKAEGSTYFVTFRLADSLPASVIAELKAQRTALLHNSLAAGRPLTWREERDLFTWYSNNVESLLDRGVGACWLSRADIAGFVADAMRFFHGERYELHSWVVMPNHVHAVVRPLPGFMLSEVLHSWKSFTATKANRTLRRMGHKFWQTESYDHRIRNEEEQNVIVSYVENNPVKAGLCQSAEDWRWSSAFGGA